MLVGIIYAAFSIPENKNQSLVSRAVFNIIMRPESLHHRRQCHVRVQFESRVKTKFLEPLNQILKLKFNFHGFPAPIAFRKCITLTCVGTFKRRKTGIT